MAYKLVIVGYGGMGEWHHKNVQERVEEIEVVGVFDIREERMKKAKEAGLKTYATLEEVLADKEIDIVTIATPNDFHKDIAIACMRSGKNVVCEKPVTMNAAELEAVMEVQKETGKLFSIHQNRRWDKDYAIIKEILDQNLIGKPYYIESKVQGSRRYLNGWRGYKVNGGGMLYDWGVHLIDQMLDMIDSSVTEVYTHFHSIYCEEVDDNFKMMMRFENGLSVLVEVATNCFLPQPRWHMCCIDGSVIIEDWSCNGKIVKLDDTEQLAWDDVIVYTEAGPTRTMAPRPKETTVELPLPEVKTDWTNYYKNIVGVLEGKEELIVKPEQALRVMKVIDCAFESAANGASVKCYI